MSSAAMSNVKCEKMVSGIIKHGHGKRTWFVASAQFQCHPGIEQKI